jgi:hypothetical protein
MIDIGFSVMLHGDSPLRACKNTRSPNNAGRQIFALDPLYGGENNPFIKHVDWFRYLIDLLPPTSTGHFSLNRTLR